MKYFLTAKEREETHNENFLQFEKGQYTNNTWKPDAFCMGVNVVVNYDFYNLFSYIIPKFDINANTLITKDTWDQIKERSHKNRHWEEAIDELNPWAEKCLKDYESFVIVGI